ncbi:MAG: M14 family metallopeptidase [Byssovorax sp.]
MSDPTSHLEALSFGFRRRYFTYDELTRQVHAWAKAFPAFVRVASIGKSLLGRDLWLLTIGRDPERIRPAAWVDGNMHASELCGSSVALAIAEDLIRAHLVGAGQPILDLPPHLADLIRDDVLVYVLPRMSPDGAERMVTTGAYVRSNPRDTRLGRTAPYWRSADLDGDGAARLMRIVDPCGDFIASPDHEGLMLPRRIEDPGPFYAIHPEGMIENWDGVTIPEHGFMSDNETDLNRNFPYGWAPEPRQIGAGAYPTSEPESRAVTAFATAHPNIFAWLNLHTFGGCYIRPAGDKPDKAMDQSDFAIFKQIEEWTDAITGYPMVSGFEEFTYEPDKPLCGDLSTYAYAQRGAIAMVCELWDFWKQVGLRMHRPFVHNYQRRTRDEILQMARWDREHNGGKVVGAWKPFDHPQLGPVEIGGYDPRVGIWNPPLDRLGEICDQQARVFLRIAALAPRLRVAKIERRALGPGLSEVSAMIENAGYLPTQVLSSSATFPWNDPVRARLVLPPSASLVSGPEVQTVGHLGGWGGHHKLSTPYFARTGGAGVRQRVSWVVRGSGEVALRAGAARVGQVEVSVDLGEG